MRLRGGHTHRHNILFPFLLCPSLRASGFCEDLIDIISKWTDAVTVHGKVHWTPKKYIPTSANNLHYATAVLEAH